MFDPPSQKPPIQKPPNNNYIRTKPPKIYLFLFIFGCCFVVYLVLGVSFKLSFSFLTKRILREKSLGYLFTMIRTGLET